MMKKGKAYISYWLTAPKGYWWQGGKFIPNEEVDFKRRCSNVYHPKTLQKGLDKLVIAPKGSVLIRFSRRKGKERQKEWWYL